MSRDTVESTVGVGDGGSGMCRGPSAEGARSTEKTALWSSVSISVKWVTPTCHIGRCEGQTSQYTHQGLSTLRHPEPLRCAGVIRARKPWERIGWAELERWLGRVRQWARGIHTRVTAGPWTSACLYKDVSPNTFNKDDSRLKTNK